MPARRAGAQIAGASVGPGAGASVGPGAGACVGPGAGASGLGPTSSGGGLGPTPYGRAVQSMTTLVGWAGSMRTATVAPGTARSMTASGTRLPVCTS
jgi:hypothetical protein